MEDQRQRGGERYIRIKKKKNKKKLEEHTPKY